MRRTTKLFSPVAMVVLVVLAGTLMPGSLKIAAESQLPRLLPWSAMAHFCLFALLAGVVTRQETGIRAVRPALVLAFVLAGGTEWLQRWVPGRHPRLVDVAIDMAGALLVCTVVVAMRLHRQRKRRPTAIAVDRP